MSDSTYTTLADGLAVHEIQNFTTTAELGQLLCEATEADRWVVPFGGKGSLGTGKPATADIGIDMTSNSGVISYTPADLTLSVKTGTTWAELQAALADQGQTVPLDVPHPERTTVGGVVATGFAGARKYRNGSLRDLLIGCEYLRGDGLIANAGGMVVKNVSGFEIPRFLHGSWGSLAVITSVNLKVMPRARAEETVLQSFGSIGEAVEAGLDAVRSGLPVDSIAVVSRGDETTLAIRASGRPRAVDQIATGIVTGAHNDTERLADDASAEWWQSSTNAFAESAEAILMALSLPNEQLEPLTSSLRETVASGGMCILPGCGSIRIRIPLDDQENAANLTSALDMATRHGASWVIESAPADLRQGLDVWGQTDSGHATMQAVKQSFDPANILNRGRLFI